MAKNLHYLLKVIKIVYILPKSKDINSKSNVINIEKKCK